MPSLIKIESYEQVCVIENGLRQYAFSWVKVSNPHSINAWYWGARQFLVDKGICDVTLFGATYLMEAMRTFTHENTSCSESDYYRMGLEGYVPNPIKRMSEGPFSEIQS